MPGIEQLSERDVLALTLWAEARSESLEGRVAVGCVVRNRMARRRESARAVCLAPHQFSCWQPRGGPANHAALMAMVDAFVENPGGPPGRGVADPIVRECLWIADGVLSGACRDLTKGADHYLTTALLSSTKRPGWVATMVWTATVGTHAFYRS